MKIKDAIIAAAFALALTSSNVTHAQEVEPGFSPDITVQQIIDEGADLSPSFVVPEEVQPELTEEAVTEEVVEEAYNPLDIAYAQLGKPYIWGSAGGRSNFNLNAPGFDCSGFVSFVLRVGYGIYLPAQTATSFPYTYGITMGEAMPGDIVYYNMNVNNPRIQHMAVYIGNGQIIQAGGTARGVNIASVYAVGKPTFRRVK